MKTKFNLENVKATGIEIGNLSAEAEYDLVEMKDLIVEVLPLIKDFAAFVAEQIISGDERAAVRSSARRAEEHAYEKEIIELRNKV